MNLANVLGVLEPVVTYLRPLYPLSIANALGILGAGLVILTFFMKSMLPLRTLAVASNIAFLGYAYLAGFFPLLLLHAALLPLNVKRIWDIQMLIKQIKEAKEDDPLASWLVPFMTKRPFQQGDILFCKGDPANEIIYIQEGRVQLGDHGLEIGPGAILGEIGVFSRDKARTQTVTCLTDGKLLSMTEEMIYQLYYQNPKLGFYFMRLIIRRLTDNLERQSSRISPALSQDA